MGDVAGARKLVDDAIVWLPRDGALNGQGRWSALMSVVNGLALLGDREGVAQLDPLASRLAANGMPVDTLSFGPNNVDLCAAITAQRWRMSHGPSAISIELAISRELPNRLLEPTVLYWRGRFEFDRRRRDVARPLLQSAGDQFAALGMALHRDRAARALDESWFAGK